jgi:hypothetical protein
MMKIDQELRAQRSFEVRTAGIQNDGIYHDILR